MSTFTESLRKEVERLQHELRAHPAYKKMVRVKRLLELYADDATQPAPVTRWSTPEPEKPAVVVARARPLRLPGSQDKRSASSFSGITGQAAQASVRILQERGVMMTTDLLALLEQQGINIGGANPRNNLSSLLSKTAEVMPGPGKRGWQLVQMSEEELADSADPEEETLPAMEPRSTPVEPGEEVAHDNTELRL